MFDHLVVSRANPKDEQAVDGGPFRHRSGLFLGILILIPLIYTEALPKAIAEYVSGGSAAAAASAAACRGGTKM